MVRVRVLIMFLRDSLRDYCVIIVFKNYIVAFFEPLWDNLDSGKSVFSVFTVMHLHKNLKMGGEFI